MALLERNSAGIRRREQERIMVQQGIDLWNQNKQQKLKEKVEDQKRVMLSNYHPWGRPGGGAPNPSSIRRQTTNVHFIDSKVGLGSNLRAPVLRRADPALRFQFHAPTRRCVENDLRYRKTIQDQLVYKQQLDFLVTEKKQIMAEEKKREAELHRNLGWTGEPAFRRLEHDYLMQEERRTQVPKYPMLTDGPHNHQQLNRKDFHPPEELLTGGVELVPLLARRRVSFRRNTLPTTDVTKIKNNIGPQRPVWKQVPSEREYLQELTNQVIAKEMQVKEQKNEDLAKSQRHFETWRGFWGRPGHGAPKGINVKENLDYILYQLPIKS